MKVLAFDLSTARGGIAVLGDNLEVMKEWANDRKHSGAFFENLREFTEKVGRPDKIIVGLGPGSYAGTRIAISAAIGLQAAGIQLAGYPSICAMESSTGDYCVIGDARRQSFFFAQIHRSDLAEGPILLSEAQLREKLDTVDGSMSIFCSEPLPQFERAELAYPSAMVLARLGQEAKRALISPPLEPMYLREPHITVPRST